MHIKITIFLLLLEIINRTCATTLRANELIQNICDTLHNHNSLDHDEDQQWEIICQQLFQSKDGDQHIRRQRDTINEEEEEEEEEDIPPNKKMRKIGVRGSGGIRGGSGIRSGSGIRIGTGSRSPSVARYQNTYTGQSMSRPGGWQWSRTGLIFLPLAIRSFSRTRSSSDRYTTPATSSLTYYYCTSDTNSSVEIQCSSTDGDGQCCEDETTYEAFCCGGDIPDYILQDMNRATQTIARIFYTLAALALCMHLFMRRFYC